jgi:pilus assembly protein CpaE
MTEASVVAVGTPQSFRQQIARAMEVEPEEIGWAQSATVAEELLINAFTPVDVLVLSPEVKEPDALGLAEFMGRQSPGTAIVLVRDHTWNGLLPAAMRAGIRDVVDMTQGTEELRDAVERAVAWATNLRSMGGNATESSQQQRGRIIAIFSSKGGSGKTFLTTNLAAAISDITGQDTAVVDLDTDMGDVFTYFGREPSARVDDMMGLGEGADHERIREIGVPFGEHLWGYGSPPDPAAEPPAGEAVGKFLRTLRADFSYVVVDASVDYSDSALVCFDLSDAICLVTPLDVVGVKHLSKALDTLLTIGLPRERFRVVLNRADSKVGLDASDVERVMKITVDAMIPSSRLVPTALNKGRPVVLDEPGSDVSTAVRQLATRFATQFEVSETEARKNANGNVSKPVKTKRKRFSRTAG